MVHPHRLPGSELEAQKVERNDGVFLRDMQGTAAEKLLALRS
jgi:hypothetical protein